MKIFIFKGTTPYNNFWNFFLEFLENPVPKMKTGFEEFIFDSKQPR